MRRPELVELVLRSVPDVGEVATRLAADRRSPVASVAGRRPASRRGRRLGAVVGAPLEELPTSLRNPERAGRKRTLDAAERAAAKIAESGTDADLTPEEVAGAEAIIVVFGRPAILVQDGRFFPPPHPWEKLEECRADIEAVLPRVGRIEVAGHPRYEWVGTGFVAGDGLVLTNRHVAKEFARPVGRGKWDFEAGMTVTIDFAEELSSAAPREHPVTEVVAVHEEVDLAVLRVGPRAGGTAVPAALPLSRAPQRARKGRQVYVVGYPAADPGRNDAEVMGRIFNDIYNVKRLQPGGVRGTKGLLHSHDCSTLGGNSGSCVVDLETHQVVGLHFQGRYLEANWAVTLSKLLADPKIKKAGLNFV
ncbi:MAG: hypothetical protein AVDCRST_MAG50-1285 [uncultured Acidimicrobiales bacterium]|uniref:Serine protease n=1 Tax=uncultured Acidimicrobiales bacterium TaxID=310071 RepID=A0A6J4HT15_9ACTN|nr:MAG: hypothetical protein AVDCRST_MAG50-1285 [uncultured Acidimicrobiales bacterium]